MGMGSFAAGVVAGVILTCVFAEVASEGWQKTIEEKAIAYKDSGDSLNVLFEKTGKGLLSIKAAGKVCVIDVKRDTLRPDATSVDGRINFSGGPNKAKSDLVWMGCVAR